MAALVTSVAERVESEARVEAALTLNLAAELFDRDEVARNIAVTWSGPEGCYRVTVSQLGIPFGQAYVYFIPEQQLALACASPRDYRLHVAKWAAEIIAGLEIASLKPASHYPHYINQPGPTPAEVRAAIRSIMELRDPPQSQ